MINSSNLKLLRHKILIIEDNSLTVKLVRLTLETEGYAVVVSGDGASAISTLNNERPDLVLLDMRLPDTDGLTLIKQLRALPNGESIPIIAFSGFVSMVEEAKIANSDFSDFLLKPIEPSLLLKCVEKHLINLDIAKETLAENKRVLILDDDPLQLKFTCLQFQYYGFEVIQASDGVQGLLQAEKYPPDVIISDVLMPNMDGFQFCKAIRKIPSLSQTPIILVSANYVEEIDKELAKSIGANGYVYRSLGIQKVIDSAVHCLSNNKIFAAVEVDNRSAETDNNIHARMLQQLERQVSINFSSRQRNYVQHTILGQISYMADSLLDHTESSLSLDDILSRCLDSAGLSHGVFYYYNEKTMLKLRAQFGFSDQLELLQNCFNHHELLIDIIQNEKIVAIPSDAMAPSISQKILAASGSDSALFIPVRGNNDAFGLLLMFSEQRVMVDEDWIAFGVNVAAQFSQTTELSDALARLVDSEHRFRQLAENVQETFFLIVPFTHEILYLSPAYEKIWGRPIEALINKPDSWIDSVILEDKPLFENMLKRLFSSGEFSQEFRITTSDGLIKWVRMRGTPIYDESGDLSRVAGTAEDISERKHSEMQLQYLNRLYELLSGINALIVRAENYQELFQDTCQIAVEIGEFDLTWIGFINYQDNRVIPSAQYGKGNYAELLTEVEFSILPNRENHNSLISKAIQTRSPQWISGICDEVMRANTKQVLSLEDCRSIICLPLISDNTVTAITMIYSKRLMAFNDDKVKLLTVLARDISYAFDFLKTKESLEFLALHDPLTGLGNRVRLKQRITLAIEGADAGGYTLALMLININRFRDINDTLGHRTGDQLLNEIAQRLVDTVWKSDMVACLGGDEFALLIPHLTEEHDMQLVANKVCDALLLGFQIETIPLHLEARMGIAQYPKHGLDAGTLWRCADVALCSAGKRKESVCFYDADYDDYDSKNLALLGELRDAFDRNELVLHWQPKIDLKSQLACGVEALIRWQHPTRGLLYPDSFIPNIEQTGLIQPLTKWVIDHAINQAQLWNEQGYELNVAINISVRNLQEKNFDRYILNTAKKHNIPIGNIIIEVTESAVMDNVDRAKAALEKLRSAGVQIALDDFGTGQSSLTYLKDLPITDMKIDKSFVMELTNRGNLAIVKSAIDLAHNLGFSTTAEGVEDEAALHVLESLGCDVAQGYYMSRPLPEKQFIRWLNSSKWSIKHKGAL